MAGSNVRDDQLPAGAGSAGDVTPIPAATVILMRGDPLEVLLIRRHEKSSFVPSAWVFPGGVADPADADIARSLGDDTELGAMRVTALRELFEEAGVWLGGKLDDAEKARQSLLHNGGSLSAVTKADLEKLVWTARWITPVGVPKRFDTWFFLARATEDVASVDPTEAVDLRWITPRDALAEHAAGTLPMVFPTIKNLEAIASSESIDELLGSRRGREIPTTRPVLVIENGQKRIILPDEAT